VFTAPEASNKTGQHIAHFKLLTQHEFTNDDIVKALDISESCTT